MTARQAGYIAVHSLACLIDGGLLAATFSDGIFHLAEDGIWRDVIAGLPTRNTGDFTQGPDGRVYVVTIDGVYASTAWRNPNK